MKIIISPAKKMKVDTDTMPVAGMPVFLSETERLMAYMQQLSYPEAKKLWSCNDSLAELNYKRFRDMDLTHNLTPALLSYEGIQYQYMAPVVFDSSAFTYVQEHLRILSGFYGILKPFDGVTPYRLEMQAKAKVSGTKSLYEFWGRRLYEQVTSEDHVILNLASKEYSKCIEAYLQPEDVFITCIFGELSNGKVVQKGTLAKMTRGEMVRYMAENGIENPLDIRKFDRLDYRFSEQYSTDREYVFLKKIKE